MSFVAARRSHLRQYCPETEFSIKQEGSEIMDPIDTKTTAVGSTPAEREANINNDFADKVGQEMLNLGISFYQQQQQSMADALQLIEENQ